MQRKIHNQTLFVAALSVYFGLLIAGAPPHVLAQQIEAQIKQESVKNINRRPLDDFARELKQQIAAGQINFDNSCSVSVKATLETTGRLSNAKVVNKTGDDALCVAAVKLLTAIDSSGALSYISDAVKFAADATFTLDAANGEFKFTNSLLLDSAHRAKTLVSFFNAAQIIVQSQKSEARAAAQDFLRTTKVAAQEKEFIITTLLPRASLDALLKADEKAN